MYNYSAKCNFVGIDHCYIWWYYINMLDKIFEVFRKVDRTINTVDGMQRTAERVEYQAQNLKGGSRNLKWIILAVILAIAVIYAVWGQ